MPLIRSSDIVYPQAINAHVFVPSHSDNRLVQAWPTERAPAQIALDPDRSFTESKNLLPSPLEHLHNVPSSEFQQILPRRDQFGNREDHAKNISYIDNCTGHHAFRRVWSGK